MRIVAIMLVVLAFAYPSAAQTATITDDNTVTSFTSGQGITVQKTVWDDGRSLLEIHSAVGTTTFSMTGYSIVLTEQGQTFAITPATTEDQHRAFCARLVLSANIGAYRVLLSQMELQPISTESEVFIVDAALLGTLTGDASAIHHEFVRLQQVVSTGPEESATTSQTDCLSQYTAAIMRYFSMLETCNRNAYQIGMLYGGAAQLWACQAAYFARTQAATWQAIACGAIPTR